MREIKFKGQVIGGHGKWIYGNSLIQNDAGTKYIGDNIAPSKINESNVHEVVHVCVFTGSKDCDGNEIYEGDIAVTNDKDEPIHVILTWIKQNAMFAWLTVDEYIDYHHSGSIDIYNTMFWIYAFDDDSVKDIRVIGNVFDNKDLLK